MRTPGKIIPERPGAWVLSAFVFLDTTGFGYLITPPMTNFR